MSQSLQFEFLALAIGVLALIVLYIAYRLLATSHWVMGWIQGNAGLGLLLLSGVLALVIMDIRSYRPMFNNVSIATLSLHTLGPGSHQLRLVDSQGIEQAYTIAGDQYQLVIRQFKWATRFAGMGMGHGYRVDHLVTVVANNKIDVPVSASGHFDTWQFFHKHFSEDFLLAAVTVETLPRQVVDGGMYELIPEGFDIEVVPLNQVAKEAEAAALPQVDVNAPAAASVVEAPAPAAVVAPVAVAPAVPVVAPPTTAPAPVPPVAAAPAVAKPAPAKTEEVPGAHIQATPATFIEKPAGQKSN